MGRDEKHLIEQYIHHDEELKRYVLEHRKLEEALEEFNRRRHLTPEEEAARKNLQKLKLREKEKIIRILDKYRQ